MTEYRTITITKGSGGFGGPLTLTPDATRNKIVYIVGGGMKPEVVDRIAELSGAEPVNGFQTTVPDEQIFLAVIDCGGTLRCGLYPKKGIHTVNVMQTGKAGPLAQFITEDLYVSAVSPAQVQAAEPALVAAAAGAGTAEADADGGQESGAPAREGRYSTDKKISETVAAKKNKSLLEKIGLGAGRVVSIFYQAARDATNTMLTSVIPFMGFVAMLIGIINASGFGTFFSHLLEPLAGNGIGLIVLGFICSIPFLSPLLGPGGVIGGIIGTLIGNEIAQGKVPPHLALPALFAINTQNAADFIPVGLGLAEAEPETVEVGVPAILYSRFLNGAPRVAIAWLASVGLYSGAN
ncbi:MAG: glucitol/sorbitol-specific PTS transporter subunit IIBC [Dermabacter sp.]|nr:glucitol/sorbitol-specific PTS transporter subunit IIBC [Dermabacter sp.]